MLKNWTKELEESIRHICDPNTVKGKDDGKKSSANVEELSAKAKLNNTIEAIKENSQSQLIKSEQVVKAYEDYLYSRNKSAFERYWQVLSENDGSNDTNNENIVQAQKALEKALQSSGTDIRKVLQNMGDDLLAVNAYETSIVDFVTPTATIQKNKHFIDLVNTDQPLDLKNRGYQQSHSSIWSAPWEEGMREDYAGNYLFGYFGKGYLNSPDDYLKYGAGAAQGWSDKNVLKWNLNMHLGNYGDNAGDSQMIQDGINDYKGNN